MRRRINLPLLTLYGIGTTVGAGIYVLVGKVAGPAGVYAPVAFLVAAVLAGITAFAFAELSARFPRSAGEALYIRKGFGSDSLALLVGLLVITAGTVSAAAIVVGSVGYLGELIDLPSFVATLGITALLCLIACWGIGESVSLAALITLVEVGGLILVGWAGLSSEVRSGVTFSDTLPPFEGVVWAGILAGAVLAFYAFIGFEDMVNVAEEVKDETRTLPTGIILTLVVTTLVYLLVAYTAVFILPVDDLVDSDAPLALLYARSSGSDPIIISAIAVFATLNGSLIQIIMGSRVIYGLASQKSLPAFLARVNPWTRTPLIATILVSLVVLVLASVFPIERLAGFTALVTLAIFTLVNGALLRIRLQDKEPPQTIHFPLWLPGLGALVSFGFLLFEILRLADFF